MSTPPPLSRFELQEELGSGTTGTVYRAIARTRGKGVQPGDEVAVKFLRQDLLLDEKARDRFLEEGRMGMAVQSPHVTRIFAVESVPLLGLNLSYLVMELIRGRTLRAMLEEGPVPEPTARRIAREIALGLSALHRRRIVHRDLKPENVHLTESGLVKVMDLGLARQARWFAGRDDQSGRFYGTLAYAAPEALRDGGGAPAADLFALGVIFHELLTGQHPFLAPGQGTTPEEALQVLRHAELPRLEARFPRLSSFAGHLLRSLLASDPKDRPERAEEVATILEEGENSEFHRTCEHQAARDASRTRLQALVRAVPARMAGRDQEQRALQELVDRARLQSPQLVLLTGPRAAGKRRLVTDVLTQRVQEGERVLFLSGRAGAPDAEGPLAPFAAMLTSHIVRSPERPPASMAEDLRRGWIARCAARLTQELRVEPLRAELLAGALLGGAGTEAERALVADEIAALLLRTPAEDELLCLLVDRADLLDGPAILVLERMLARDPHAPLLVALVHHDERRLPADLEEHFDPERSRGDGPWQRLTVPPLDAPAFAEVCAVLFADPGEGSRLGERFHAQIGGNPGHLLASLEILAGQGRLSGTPGSYRVEQEIEEAPLPRSVSAACEDVVATLPEPVRVILRALAVLGDRAERVDLAAVAEVAPEPLYALLLPHDGRVLQLEPDSARFVHRGFHEAVLRGIPAAGRMALHARAASHLTARGRGPLVVGLHWSMAGQHGKAVPLLLMALVRLVREGSLARARRVAERVRLHLNALPRTRPRLIQRTELQLLRGETFGKLGLDQESRKALMKALRIARHLKQPRAIGEAHLGLSRLAYGLGHMLGALQYLDPASKAFAETRDARGLLRTQLHRAMVLGFQGRLSEGLEQALQAVARAQRSRDPELLPEALLLVARFHARRNHAARAAALLDQAEERFQAAGMRGSVLKVRHQRARLQLQFGRVKEALAILKPAREQALVLHGQRMTGRIEEALAECHLELGQPDLARTHAERALRTVPRTGDRFQSALAHKTLALICLAEEPPAVRRAREEASLALDLARELSLPRLSILAAHAMARVHLVAEEWEAVLAQCDWASSIARKMQIGFEHAAALEDTRAGALRALGRSWDADISRKRADRVRAALRRRMPEEWR
jgi:tetratricopeptide (TPR) repeat protein